MTVDRLKSLKLNRQMAALHMRKEALPHDRIATIDLEDQRSSAS